MQDKLDSKNTYMSYFKKEDVKIRDDLEEKTRTHVTHSVLYHLVLLWHGPWGHRAELLPEMQIWKQMVQT